MRFIPAICILALTVTPALARDHLASLQPLELMHISPAQSTPAPSAPAAIPHATTAVLIEVERKADLARIKSDAFDQRIRESSERAMASVCTGCLTMQAKATRVRVRLSGDAVDTDRAVRTTAFKPTARAASRYVAVAW